MKRFLTLAVVLSLAVVPALAQQVNIDKKQADKVAASLSGAKAKSDKPVSYPSTGASDKGSVKFSFTAVLDLQLVKNKDFNNTLTSKKECRAVVIDKNWLLASKNCAVNDDYVTHNAYRGAGSAPDQEDYKVIGRSFSDYKITVDDKAYGVKVFDIGNEFLIYATDSELSAKLDKLPKANILITGDDAGLASYKNFTLVIRRDGRYGGEVSDKVEVDTLCTATACIKVENKTFHPDGSAGDPMFLKLDNNQEFIVAFNAAQNYSGGSKGRMYKTISPASGAKIEQYIKKYTPEAYPAVAKKMVKKIKVTEKSFSFE